MTAISPEIQQGNRKHMFVTFSSKKRIKLIAVLVSYYYLRTTAPFLIRNRNQRQTFRGTLQAAKNYEIQGVNLFNFSST